MKYIRLPGKSWLNRLHPDPGTRIIHPRADCYPRPKKGCFKIEANDDPDTLNRSSWFSKRYVPAPVFSIKNTFATLVSFFDSGDEVASDVLDVKGDEV